MPAIVLFLLVGFAAQRGLMGGGRSRALGDGGLLDKAILDWLLPIAVAYNVTAAEWTGHAATVVLLCVAITVVDASLVLAACHIWRCTNVATRTLLVVAPLGNTAYFGFPAILAILGTGALPDAILFDQLGTTLMLVTYGNLVARGQGLRLSGSDLTEAAHFRPLWGLLIGVAVGALGGDFGWDPAESVGVAATHALLPVSMIALGAKLASKGVELNRDVAIGVVIRGVVGPAVLFGILTFAAVKTAPLSSALLQTAMPPMVGAALLAERRGLDARLAYSLCGVAMVIACCVLPVYGMLLQ